MDKLKGKDIDEVVNLIQRYPAPLQTSNDVHDFFVETQKTFDSDELVFLYPNTRNNGIDRKRSFSLQDKNAFLSRYADHFWKYDPLYNAQLSTEYDTLAFRTQDIVPYKSFSRLQYYNDFLQPQNLFSELVIRLCFKSFFLGAISLLRSKNKPVFNKKDIRKAELLVPYIINMVDVGEMFSRNFEEQKLFELWLESQSEGVILLDMDFRTLFSNSKADIFCALLAGKNPHNLDYMETENTRVPDVIIRDCQCLSRSRQSNDGLPGYDNRIVNLPSRKRYHLQYFTFAPVTGKITRPSFIVIINDLNRYASDDEEIFINHAKLSSREAIVARYAGMGWTNKEIADSIHSSPFTIQNQLKKVFEKTGLKNRTQLANLMKYSDSLHPRE